MSRLGGFVKLVDQILLSHLVELSRMSITSFVTKTMKVDPQGQRDGFFQAALVFTSKGKYIMSFMPFQSLSGNVPRYYINCMVEIRKMCTHGLRRVSLPVRLIQLLTMMHRSSSQEIFSAW